MPELIKETGTQPTGVIVDPSEKAEEKEDDKEELPLSITQKFMFNIADGGFTDLHHLWSQEKKKGI